MYVYFVHDLLGMYIMQVSRGQRGIDMNLRLSHQHSIKRPLLVLVLAVGMHADGMGSALAQSSSDPIEVLGWTIEPRASLTVALSPGRDDSAGREAEVVTADLKGELQFERVLENGAEIGVWIGGRLQRDHPERAGFSGQIGPNTAIFDGLAPRGAFTGLTLGGVDEDNDVRVQLETGFIYIDGGYGQLLAGRDTGVARRFHEGAPSVFNLHTVTNARLDTSGIATLLTRNDLTGPAAKISYASPRLLGLRLGASYTPRANVSGVDRDPDLEVSGVNEPRLENGLEAAFNFRHRFREWGVSAESYGAYARAELETGPLRLNTGTVEVWSTGGRLAWDNLEFGADWLTTDNGAGRYRAWSVGAQSRLFEIDVSGEFGRSFDDITGIDGRAWSVGASKEFWEKLTITAGIQRQELLSTGLENGASTGPVLEMTLRY